jgi:hypothetical protein
MNNIDNINNFNNICGICEKEPGSHSFVYLCRTKKPDIYEYIFYTCIGDVKKYQDTEGTIQHYLKCLTLMNPDKWIWIFNFDGMSTKHYTEITLIKKLTRILKEFGKIENVFLVNPPKLLNIVLTLIRPILDKKTFDKILIVNEEELTKKLNVSKEDNDKIRELVIKKYN